MTIIKNKKLVIVLAFLCSFAVRWFYIMPMNEKSPWYSCLDQDIYINTQSMAINSGFSPDNLAHPGFAIMYFNAIYLQVTSKLGMENAYKLKHFIQSPEPFTLWPKIIKSSRSSSFLLSFVYIVFIGLIISKLTHSWWMFIPGAIISNLFLGVNTQAIMIRSELLSAISGMLAFYLGLWAIEEKKYHLILSLLSGLLCGFSVFGKVMGYPFLAFVLFWMIFFNPEALSFSLRSFKDIFPFIKKNVFKKTSLVFMLGLILSPVVPFLLMIPKTGVTEAKMLVKYVINCIFAIDQDVMSSYSMMHYNSSGQYEQEANLSNWWIEILNFMQYYAYFLGFMILTWLLYLIFKKKPWPKIRILACIVFSVSFVVFVAIRRFSDIYIVYTDIFFILAFLWLMFIFIRDLPKNRQGLVICLFVLASSVVLIKKGLSFYNEAVAMKLKTETLLENKPFNIVVVHSDYYSATRYKMLMKHHYKTEEDFLKRMGVFLQDIKNHFPR